VFSKIKAAFTGLLDREHIKQWRAPEFEFVHLPQCIGSLPTALVEATLAELRLPCTVTSVSNGPVTTSYKLSPLGSTRISLLPSRATDIAVRLGVPFNVLVDNDELIIPNKERTSVDFAACLPALEAAYSKLQVPYIVGLDSHGQVRIADLTKHPHILVAGQTGSGKSVWVNNMIACLMAAHNPSVTKLVMIDPKRVEYGQYKKLPFLLHPVVDEIPQAVAVLEGMCKLMDHRYAWLQKAGYQSVEQWNQAKAPSVVDVSPQQARERIYPIVVFIDEYADLVAQDKRAKVHVARLGQKARAAGIHLVLCTQHPKAEVISTTITSNFPAQIAFRVRTTSASGVILDRTGAENLMGKGDLMFQDGEQEFRAQGPFVTPELTSRLVNHWVNQ